MRTGKDGDFQRKASVFRNWITPDGQPGPSGNGGFRAEPGRYHLYISLACPWAHRTLIVRQLKRLQETITCDIVHPINIEAGWSFETDFEATTGDTINGRKHLSEIYVLADPKYTGRVTVPTLWDKQQNTIVSNESAEIIRMFNSAFGDASGPDLYPADHREEIDQLNDRIYSGCE